MKLPPVMYRSKDMQEWILSRIFKGFIKEELESCAYIFVVFEITILKY
jgi:hypothetical protein